MRALVTGASGLVGGEVVRRFAETGWEVVGLTHTRPWDGLECLAIDIGTAGAANEVARSTAPCELIVHAAASLAKDDSDPVIPLANCLGTQQMIQLGRIWNTRRFVYVSSITVIGSPVEIPISEDHPTLPASAYQASKLYGEHLVRIAGATGLSGISLRLTAPIGPRMSPERIVSVFVRRALAGERLILAGRGTRRQNYIDVRDAAAAIELAARSGTEGAVNVGGHTISNHDLAKLCCSSLGSTSAIGFASTDPEEEVDWGISQERAHVELGYKPRCSLQSSIRSIALEYSHGIDNP